MLIDVIDDFETFTRLRENWESTYDTDPDAQFFLSWLWLSQWLPTLTSPWFILAARPAADADYVAFFPLQLRTKERKAGGFYNEIFMAGSFAADYTGFICHPDWDSGAIPALARHLKKLHWARLNLDNIRTTKDRMRLFMSHFPEREFLIKEVERINKPDNINNSICPYTTLAADWDSYLANNMSANSRQKLRRFLRQIEADSTFRITHSTPDTIDRDLKILLRFWEKRWAARKGDRTASILRSNYRILTRCSEIGVLYLPILWKDNEPLGALASFMDRRKRTVFFYMAGRNEVFNDPPPGLVLHAHSIRHAISLGFTTYDFMRGNEPYKYSFGANTRLIECRMIGTKDGRNLNDKLDRRCLPHVLDRSTKLHKADHLAEAEIGYRQIIAADPGNTNAIYCLGQLMMAKGKYGAAKRMFKTLISLNPTAEKAWLWLGKSLEGRQNFTEALDAYNKALSLNPDFAIAHNKLGSALFKLGRYAEAIEAFDKALNLAPNYKEAEISRANTLHMIGALPLEKLNQYAELNAQFGDKIIKTGEIPFAIQCYRQAITMQPALAHAHYGLGQAFQSLNDIDSALQSYRKAAELEPGYRNVSDLVVKLSRSARHAPDPIQSTHASHA